METNSFVTNPIKVERGPVYLNEDSGVYKWIPEHHVILRIDYNTQRLLLKDSRGYQIVCSFEAYSQWLRTSKVSRVAVST